jgi:regulatory protein SWI6
LKRSHSQVEDFDYNVMMPSSSQGPQDFSSAEPSRPPSTSGVDGTHPTKRPRKDLSPPSCGALPLQPAFSVLQPAYDSSQLDTLPNGTSKPDNGASINGKLVSAGGPSVDDYKPRLATKASPGRVLDPSVPLRDPRRASIVSTIFSTDDPAVVLEGLRQDQADGHPTSTGSDVDLVLDDQGHTALHLAASMARMGTVEMLLAAGADAHRGNFHGETPLMRACLAMHCYDQQAFERLVELLRDSIRTIDTSRKSVCHHIVALAGVKGRAIAARYYLDSVFKWIAQHEGGNFRSLIDLQDEHGDTALNVAARVGNRGLVKTLLDVGANRVLANKLGLRPGDFGVEVEELGGGSRAEDIMASLRSAPAAPVQKSQDVINGEPSLSVLPEYTYLHSLVQKSPLSFKD